MGASLLWLFLLPLSPLWASPAVHNDGPGMRQTLLPLVDLVQEAEDTPRLTGDPVVRPAQVLVVPDLPNQVTLDQGHRRGQHPTLPYHTPSKQGLQEWSGAGNTHIVQWGHL